MPVNFLHVDMIHLSPGERAGLLSRASIAITILCLRAVISVVSGLPALETSNLTQILLGERCSVRAVLIAACSIPVSILGATVIMRISYIVGMASMVMGISSRVRGKMRLLLSS